MGIWKKLGWVFVAVGAAVVVSIAGPAVLLGEASALTTAIVADAVVVLAVSTVKGTSDHHMFGPHGGLSRPDPHFEPMIIRGTPTTIPTESVGSNDMDDDDPFDEEMDDPVDVDEIPLTGTDDGMKPDGPGSDTEDETKSPHPHVSKRGDFSGLVKTFYNPVTSRIIGYKGIPRKRKFISLQRFSPFWKEHMRLTPASVLAGPS